MATRVVIGALLGIVAVIRLRGRTDLGGRGAAVAAIPTGFVVFLDRHFFQLR